MRTQLIRIKEKAALAQKRVGFKHSVSHWLPEHVRMAILAGLAGRNTVELYFVVDPARGEENVLGFFIVSSQPDEFAQVPLVMTVWMVWARPGHGYLVDMLLPYVERLAIERGCVELQHVSGRMGHMRKPRGFRVSQYVYRKEVQS